MENSKEDSRELCMEEYVNKMESELKVIKDSKDRDGSHLKALQESLINGSAREESK